MTADIRIIPAHQDAVEAIDPILEAYPYNDYRRYPSVDGKAAAKYLKGVVTEMVAQPGVETWLATLGTESAGVAALSPLAWDSDFFGLRMGRLSLFIAKKEGLEVYSVADELIDAALGAARHAELQHLSLRVDVEDIGVVHALEKNGFRLMDTLFTYAFHPRKSRLPDIRPAYDLRTYRPEDYEAVMDISTTAFEGYPSRFTVDPHIPKDRAQAFYLEWAEKCCRGDLADEVLVAERKGRVIGYLAFRCNRGLERHTGVRVMGGGLGACYPLRFNAYLELLWEATRRALTTAAACDCETQSFNMATANFYQKLDFRYMRAKYSFHRWLG